MLPNDRIQARLEYLIKLCLQTLESKQGYNDVDTAFYSELRSSSLSFIQSVFGTSHPFSKAFDNIDAFATAYQTEQIRGILRSVELEFRGGWIDGLQGLLRAEVFDDFMDMAYHLLAQGYKDAAAVIAGSTLEGHLRALATTQNLAITRKKDEKEVPLAASALNTELAKAGVYGPTQQKSVTNWLGLRNDAAHGHDARYSVDEVKVMCDGIRVFISQTA